MAWTAPKGYALCADCSCSRPVPGEKEAERGTWHCAPSSNCKAEGCTCYLCVVAPGEKHLRIEAKEGQPGSRNMPPGWAYVCACMKETGEPKETGWSNEREDLGWIAPKGYKFAPTCPTHCQLPRSEPGKPDFWYCGSKDAGSPDSDCYLVGVPPDEKQLEFLAGPGHSFRKDAVPPGWSIFCICLVKA
jgi:hypothetical protein